MVYNLIQEACSNLAILAFLDVRIKRTKEIEAPVQTGSKSADMKGYNIEFCNVSFAYGAEK